MSFCFRGRVGRNGRYVIVPILGEVGIDERTRTTEVGMPKLDLTFEAGYRKVRSGRFAGVIVRRVGDRRTEERDVRDGFGRIMTFETDHEATQAALGRVRSMLLGSFLDDIENVRTGLAGEVRRLQPEEFRRRMLRPTPSNEAVWPRSA